MKLVVLGIACIAAAGALAVQVHGQVWKTSSKDLTRTDCARITVFSPAGAKSPEDLCRPYGGLALANAAPSDEGLVILVRNQPMGGFKANTEIR